MRQVLRQLLFILTELFAVGGNTIIAQEIDSSLIYDGGGFNEWWAADSSRYVFFDAANASAIEFTAILSEPNWIAYDIQTGNSEQSEHWLLQPELTPEEEELFNPSVGYEGETGYIFSSPMGRYLVFFAW